MLPAGKEEIISFPWSVIWVNLKQGQNKQNFGKIFKIQGFEVDNFLQS